MLLFSRGKKKSSRSCLKSEAAANETSEFWKLRTNCDCLPRNTHTHTNTEGNAPPLSMFTDEGRAAVFKWACKPSAYTAVTLTAQSETQASCKNRRMKRFVLKWLRRTQHIHHTFSLFCTERIKLTSDFPWAVSAFDHRTHMMDYWTVPNTGLQNITRYAIIQNLL